jgi:hypothetical protein
MTERNNDDKAECEAIYSYTRAEALDDGVLVDVSATAREVGIRYPTALTASVWADYVRVPEGVDGQDEAGRLWDILWMFSVAIRHAPKDCPIIHLELAVRNDNRRAEIVALKAVCGPGDELEPVVTVMLPDED